MGKQKAPVPAGDQVNAVRLRGRLPAAAQERVLPSGAEITTWRIVVPREPGITLPRADGRRGAAVDTFDCSAWRPELRREAENWQPDDVVEVDGALQRRFYRVAGQLVSRHEVVARAVRRIARVDAPTAPT